MTSFDNRFMELLKYVDEATYIKDMKLIFEIISESPAPASATHHNCFEYGNIDHTLNVMEAIVKYQLYPCGKRAKMLRLALLHDWGKVNAYDFTSDGIEKILSYDDILETFYSIGKFGLELDEEEKNAIAFHHGGWTRHSNANRMNSLAVYLHCADLIASQVIER